MNSFLLFVKSCLKPAAVKRIIDSIPRMSPIIVAFGCLLLTARVVNSQEIPGLRGIIPSEFDGCTEGGYQRAVSTALTSGSPTADVHREWYQACLITHLYRGQYLDPWLEVAIRRYLDWQIGINQTGDEIILQTETDAARYYLGKGLSNAVDRANDNCSNANDWRLARNAISWWQRAQNLNLAVPRYRLDQDNFLDRLCVKVFIKLSNPIPVLDFSTYELSYKVGIKVGEHPVKFDVPIEQNLIINGGIIKSEIDEVEFLDSMSSEDEARLDEFFGSDDPWREDFRELSQGSYGASIQPGNDSTGLYIEIDGSMRDIPLVSKKMLFHVKQNPYHHSVWNWELTQDITYQNTFLLGRMIMRQGNDNGGNEFYRLKGKFQLVWAPPSGRGIVLKFSNFSGTFQWIENPDEWCTGHQGGPISLNYYSGKGFASNPHKYFPRSRYYTTPPLIDVDYMIQSANKNTVPSISMSINVDANRSARQYFVTCRNSYGDTSRAQHIAGVGIVAPGGFLPLENGEFDVTIDNFPNNGAITVLKNKLACVAGCPTPSPMEPEPTTTTTVTPSEPDFCSEAWITDTCEGDLRRVIQSCSKLEDWQVRIDWSDERDTQLFCETLDCANHVGRATGGPAREPFNVIQHSTSADCSTTSERSCTIDCIGF